MTFRNRWSGTEQEVTCIACGESVARSAAREYDKHGDRWQRADKRFEYLCKPCDRQRCHSPRDGLEARLVEVGTGTDDAGSFISRYLALAREGESAAADE